MINSIQQHIGTSDKISMCRFKDRFILPYLIFLFKIAGMKKILIFLVINLILITFSVGNHTPGIDHDQWRKTLFSLNKDSNRAHDLYKKINEVKNPSSLIIAYKATILAHMAKSSSSIFDQIKYLSKSINLLDQAVALASDHPEIRFLRFAVQVQLPALFRSATKIKADRKFLENNYHRISWSGYSPEEADYIRNFLRQYDIE